MKSDATPKGVYKLPLGVDLFVKSYLFLEGELGFTSGSLSAADVAAGRRALLTVVTIRTGVLLVPLSLTGLVKEATVHG
ncbi:MAG: hypothetical protein JSU72_07895 [Deltaproteobacteria bacterium]|nr:MAG: hypothetical protein JSU72_07895 [Deltaproteobacteria bacterium]